VPHQPALPACPCLDAHHQHRRAEADFCFIPPAQLPRHLILHEQHANDKPRGKCFRNMAFDGLA
jgi:hypothetical protein